MKISFDISTTNKGNLIKILKRFEKMEANSTVLDMGMLHKMLHYEENLYKKVYDKNQDKEIEVFDGIDSHSEEAREETAAFFDFIKQVNSSLCKAE